MLIISIGWLLVKATVTILASVLLFISYTSFVYSIHIVYIFLYKYLLNLYVQVLVKARDLFIS